MQPVRRMQQGFTLLELAVVFALLAVAIIGSLSLAEYARRIDQGRAVGKYMLTLNLAMVEYKTQFKDKLIAMPPECSFSTYGIGAAKTAPTIAVHPVGSSLAGKSLCSMLVLGSNAQNNVVVNNGLQPTFAELKALKILNPGNNGALAITTDKTRSVASNDYAAGSQVYGFLLSRQCKAENCDPATGPFNLQSLVFNIQPYRIDRSLFGSGARVAAAITAMEGIGYLSQLGGDGMLRNMLNQDALPNPISDVNGTGIVGIIAAYDGWHMGNERFTYRDGSRPPTSNWHFNGKELTNVSNLGVTGEAKIGSATIGNKSKLQQVQMGQKAKIGAECTTDDESFARDEDKPTELLTCYQGVWSPPTVVKAVKTLRFWNKMTHYMHSGGAGVSFKDIPSLYIEYTNAQGKTVKLSNILRYGDYLEVTLPWATQSMHIWTDSDRNNGNSYAAKYGPNKGVRIIDVWINDATYRTQGGCFTLKGGLGVDAYYNSTDTQRYTRECDGSPN